LSAKKTERPLYFRQKKAGDKFKPMGLNGTKKVKDCMIDRQWEERKKGITPIITNSHGKILWIPGFAPDQSSIIDGTETEVIRLTYSHSRAL
jgi:tRNA(Ile)-lysidine synthetase-like protein